MASDTSRTKAPDGQPWPAPRLAVDTAEQLPYAFGYRPTPWQHTGERGPVHTGERDAESLVTTMLGGPWESERANLETGDYQLMGPDGAPIAGALCIERKSMADLRGSLSRGHDRLMAEMERMAPWSTPVVIVEAPIEVLLGAGASRLVAALDHARAVLVDAAEEFGGAGMSNAHNITLEAARWCGAQLGHSREEEARPGRVTVQSLLGSTLSILTDHRIPALFLPSRAWAEYAAAWIARRVWRRWLIDHPEGLAAERARLAAEAPVLLTDEHMKAWAEMKETGAELAAGATPKPASAVRVAEAGGMPWSSAEVARRREAKRRSA